MREKKVLRVFPRIWSCGWVAKWWRPVEKERVILGKERMG